MISMLFREVRLDAFKVSRKKLHRHTLTWADTVSVVNPYQLFSALANAHGLGDGGLGDDEGIPNFLPLNLNCSAWHILILM